MDGKKRVRVAAAPSLEWNGIDRNTWRIENWYERANMQSSTAEAIESLDSFACTLNADEECKIADDDVEGNETICENIIIIKSVQNSHEN